MKVKDSVCLITGSAQGLGKAFAERLLKAGARVCISDVKLEGGQATLEELRNSFGKDRVHFVQCDVTKQEEFVRLFDECEAYFNVPCVDLLVNNAGIGDNLGWRKCMEVNIMGVMIGTEIALERMKKQPTKGTIINIASAAGLATGGSGGPGLAYFVSKHGVVTLTRTLDASFAETGVEVKALCPAWADTEIVTGEMTNEKKKASINQHIKKFGGLMTTEYVAGAFYSLLTDCPRGSVLTCMKRFPYFVVPDMSEGMVRVLAMMAIISNKLSGTQTIQVSDLKMVAFFVLALLIVGVWLLAWIF